MNIHLISRNIFINDAVGNFTLDLFNYLRLNNFILTLFAQDTSQKYFECSSHPLTINVIEDAQIQRQTCFINYSILDEYLTDYFFRPYNRRILYFHNVTPGYFFREYDERFANLLDASANQYVFFNKCDAVITNSQFSLEFIRPYLQDDVPTLVFPPYFSLSRLESIHKSVPRTSDGRHHLLWVGRIAPHKRPDLALRMFDALVASGVDASLTLVGGGRYDFPRFAAHMDACLAVLSDAARGRVRFLQGLSDGELAFLYRTAALLLCTSAHEGYCMPVAEAGALGLPVAATPQPAVMETLNGGGLLLSEEPGEAAEQLRRFLLEADEAARRRAVPVLRPLPTDELLRLIRGDD